MKKTFLILFLIFSNFFFHFTYSQIFIVSKVNNEIITNYDIIMEKKYLLALNPSLRKFSEKDLEIYAKKSLINEKVKKIEIEKYFEILENDNIISKIISDLYLEIGLSSLDEFVEHLNEYSINLLLVKKKLNFHIS